MTTVHLHMCLVVVFLLVVVPIPTFSPDVVSAAVPTGISVLKSIESLASSTVAKPTPAAAAFISEQSVSATWSIQRGLTQLTSVLSDFIARGLKFGSSVFLSRARQLRDLLVTHIGPASGKFAVRWGFLLYVSARTTRTMYELYVYESVFRHSGEMHGQLMDDLDAVDEALCEMLDLITVMSNHVTLSFSVFETSAREFESLHEFVDSKLLSMRVRVNELVEVLEEEKSTFSKHRRDLVWNGLGSGVWSLGSLAIAALYPPSLPYLVATRASTIVGLSISGVNFCLAFLSRKNVDRVGYRIRQLEDIGREIDLRLNQTAAIMQTFQEVKVDALEAMRTRSAFRRALVWGVGVSQGSVCRKEI